MTCFTTVPIFKSIGPLVAEIWGGGGPKQPPPPMDSSPQNNPMGLGLTLIRLGGGGGHDGPPLDISRDYSATREALAATLYDNFLSSFPHILTPHLWRPGVRFRSYVTLCTCTSDRKWLQNVILCTKSMQIEFSHFVHINMHIFTLNCWNSLVFDLLCFKKCLPQISVKKQQKQRNT